jgi:hypothetical protein
MPKSLRVEMRLRNNVLWHAIFDKWPTVAAFCKKYGFYQTTVGGFLNLTKSPKAHSGGHGVESLTWSQAKWTKAATALARVFKIHPDDLFPERLYRLEKVRAAFEVEPPMLPMGHEALQIPAECGPSEDVVAGREMRDALRALVGSLSLREARVLNMRYGLDGGGEHCLHEVGAAIGVTQERVRQIEAKALRRLRHPSKSKHVKSFLEHLE